MRLYYKLLLLDLFKGTRIAYYYRFFNKTIKWNNKKIEVFQNKKLKSLINHFYTNSQLFKKKLDKHNISPADIKNIDDLKKIPPLTREELRENFNDLLCKNYKKKGFFSSSSGTTGIPIKYAKDVDGYSAGVAAGYLLWEMAGWKSSYKQLHIWGNPTSVKIWSKPSSYIKSFLFKKINVDSTLTNTDEGLKKVINIILRYKPESLDGYTSAIYNLALYVQKNNIQLPKVKIVITTAENLLPQQRDVIEKNLGPTADLYGCGEINGVAIKPINTNNYFILGPHVIVETETVNNDELNEVLLTDLDNRYLPFVRYKIGDLIDSVNQPVLSNKYQLETFKNLSGRTIDLIKLNNGKTISPINLLAGTLFRKIGGIIKHKVEWKKNILLFIFVVDNSFVLDQAKFEIKEYLKEYSVDFEIILVEDIKPSANGKYKYFESFL